MPQTPASAMSAAPGAAAMNHGIADAGCEGSIPSDTAKGAVINTAAMPVRTHAVTVLVLIVFNAQRLRDGAMAAVYSRLSALPSTLMFCDLLSHAGSGSARNLALHALHLNPKRRGAVPIRYATKSPTGTRTRLLTAKTSSNVRSD